ncbi:MAG: elongation factor G [Planctomycetaceae bacterium]|nr:elongation factor G [Planctomycetaceae bacterium]
MPKYTTEDIRNIALAGHGRSGKTSLAEALLHKAGVIGHIGEVEKGNTVCDFEDEEKAHGHSLVSAICHLDHQGKHVNLIDTPGYPDFLGQALSALPAVETVAVVVSAQAGIEMITRRMMERAEQRQLCRMIIVNKIDAENVDVESLVEQLRESFGSTCLPINLPTGGGTGVVDVFSKAEGEADFGDVESAHTAILDQVVEVDEEIAMAYLEGEELTAEQIHSVFERALREGHLVPICFTSAKNDVGVAELLDLFAKLMPNPSEGNPRPFLKGEQEVHAELDGSKPVIAHVFKVATDSFVGKLGAFRIHQGTIAKDTTLHVNGDRRGFKVSHLFNLQGKDHAEVDAGIPGDICALAKVEEIEQNAVLTGSADDADVRFASAGYPMPMDGFAITAKSRGDEQKISNALQRLTAEDPCFLVDRDDSTGETVIRGLGELHLRVMLEKMKNRFNCEVETSPPKIAYRETIGAKAEGHHRHKKQSGGAGQFGEVYLRVEPRARGEGFEFADEIFGGAIPQQFLPAVEKGVRQVLTEGAIAGYPLHDVRVSVYDGKFHAVDSKEVAFVTAGKRAFIDAVQKAKPVLLEPIVNVEVVVPEANMGDINSDLSGKRGRIMGADTLPGGMMSIQAQAPLAELANYQSQLKSVTGGQGSFNMEFSHYDPVPPNVQQQITKAYKPKVEED